MKDPVTIGTESYRIGKLSAMAQFHVSRRLATVLGAFSELLQAREGVSPLTAMEPLAKAIGSMSDETAERVIGDCLSVVLRHDAKFDKWAPVQNRGGKLMFDDITMPQMLQLVIEVLRENLGDFLLEIPASLTGQEATQAAQG